MGHQTGSEKAVRYHVYQDSWEILLSTCFHRRIFQIHSASFLSESMDVGSVSMEAQVAIEILRKDSLALSVPRQTMDLLSYLLNSI